jgi:hypothetical protein
MKVPDDKENKHYAEHKRKRAEQEKIVHTGFIAQEVEKIAQDLGFDFDGVHHPDNENDPYSLAYAGFVVPLVKAVQEQQEIIESQNATIETLTNQNKEIKEALRRIEEQLKAFSK